MDNSRINESKISNGTINYHELDVSKIKEFMYYNLI
jgi:hypothetical protein